MQIITGYFFLTVFFFSNSFSKVCLTYLSCISTGGLLHAFPPDFVSSVWAPLIPWLFRGLSKTTRGVSEKDRTKTFVSSYIATINGNILLVSCAEQMGMWIGVFGGGRKEMLSLLNEGRFTQYNEGWTHGFTADVYLKRPRKYCFGTEGFICRYTYPLQPLAPTWGPELSLGSLLFLFFFISKGGKMWDFIILTLWEFVWNPCRWSKIEQTGNLKESLQILVTGQTRRRKNHL